MLSVTICRQPDGHAGCPAELSVPGFPELEAGKVQIRIGIHTVRCATNVSVAQLPARSADARAAR